MKVVLDTNVVLSAALFSGPVSSLARLWRAQRISLVVSEQLWQEYKDALSRPKFKLSTSDLEMILNRILKPHCETVAEFSGKLKYPCDDPDDDLVLRCVLGGGAEALVSGDKDLLKLDGHYPFPILDPGKFLIRFFLPESAGTKAQPR